MSPLDYLLWLSEFSLELYGAYASRRIKPLSRYLLFRASADLLTFCIFISFGITAFRWADYLQRAIQLPLLAVLLMVTVGEVLREHRAIVRHYSIAGAILITLAIGWRHLGHINAGILLNFEAGVNFVLGAMLACALLFRESRGEVQKPWGMISGGLLVDLFAKFLLSAMPRTAFVARLYPVGAIVGLAVLLWAGLKTKHGLRLLEFRPHLGKKMEPTSVWQDNRSERVC